MRAVKIAVAVMSVLIVLGIAVLVVTMIDRLSAPAAPRIAATAAAVMDRLAVQLHGGGPDRVVFVDPHTATVAGRISLTK
jgi:hypothetical protein